MAEEHSTPAAPAPVAHHYKLHHDPLSSHQQIARLVRELKPSPILDVGSAQGMLGRNLKDSGLELDGVEPNVAWAESARPFYRRMYPATIENASLPKKHYKAVVCADVLEHTVDPVAVLKQLRDHATDDATFIISLPNIAHLSIRMLLLFGQFPKMNRGLLDRTHLHFFTRDTATQMLKSAGLKVQRRFATVAPLAEVWRKGEGTLPFAAMWHTQHIALRLSPGLFAYQWILVATPTTNQK